MTYRKYLKLSRTNFSVKDADKFTSVCENHFVAVYALCWIVFAWVGGFIASFLEEPVKNNEMLAYPAILLCVFGGYCVARWIYNKSVRKWKELLVVYDEMKHQRCIELELPMVLLYGYNGSQHYYYSTFLVPNYFEEQFLQFRRDDSCQKLEFEFILDKRSIPHTMKKCRVEKIKNKDVNTYTAYGITPTQCL